MSGDKRASTLTFSLVARLCTRALPSTSARPARRVRPTHILRKVFDQVGAVLGIGIIRRWTPDI